MQRSTGSWTKIGGICAVFCFYAGVRYVMLPEEMRFLYGYDCGLTTPLQTSVVAFWMALNLFSDIFVVWSIVRKRFVWQAFALLFCSFMGTWILAVLIQRQVPFL
jgi:hypothetical protein